MRKVAFFLQIYREKLAFYGVNFILQKFDCVKKMTNMRYGDELHADLTDDPLDVVAEVQPLPAVALVEVIIGHFREVSERMSFLQEGLEQTENL